MQPIGLVARVPLERDLDLLLLFGLFEVAGGLEERILRLVDVLDEVLDAAGVLVDHRLGVALGSFVDEPNLETGVEERHHLEALEQRLGSEVELLEDGRVRPEANGRTGATARRLARHRELGLELAAVLEIHVIAVAAEVDLDLDPT